MMFGERCLGLAGCGHSTNWTCPCTCDDEIAKEAHECATIPDSKVDEFSRLKAQIEGMARYVTHDTGCAANDLDYLDKSPCTCGLRVFYNPKGFAHD
ncbi:hypothetical protein [Sphingobium yanoikuyae]|uniref:hypothetical protein n=1 Tax=Sphingobium yanoikuyae TaxID=13690 RepID=UPI0028AE0562|nr:hypothetical protein [Sphingobium yanoikuyae]